MKKLITIRVTNEKTITKNVKIEFPFYKIYNLDNWTIYYKVISEKEEIHLTERDDGWEIEIDNESFAMTENEDYLLGKGEHKSNEQEFNDAMNKFHEFLMKYNIDQKAR